MSVAVLVDSASSLPPEVAAAAGVALIPMTIVIDGAPAHDDEVTTDDLLVALATGDVSTSGPNPAEFGAAISEALTTHDEVVVLTLSREMSSTHQAAELAAATDQARVRVVDTRTAAGAEGLVALAAGRRALEGASAEEVEATARDVAARVHLVATLDSLDHLVRSGRVPNIAGTAARSLRVKPLFEFRDGTAHALKPALGEQGARHRIVHACLASRPRDEPAKLHLAALVAGSERPARALLDEVLDEVRDAEWFIGSFGPVMVVHVGPSLWGLAWWWEHTR